MAHSKTQNKDLYQEVTNKIIKELENGTLPWMKPWNSPDIQGPLPRPLRANGTPYNGINILMLWLSCIENGFCTPVWLTYKQCKALGGNVRKGESSTKVVYANSFSQIKENEKGEDEEHNIPFLKTYNVFNAEQIEGLPEQFDTKDIEELKPENQSKYVNQFFLNTGAEIQYGGNQAFYNHKLDYIKLPQYKAFTNSNSHTATLAHEMIHWTSHPTRAHREIHTNKFGDKDYAREELVAELGSAFLCADLSITPTSQSNHASYISSWLKVLKEDKRAIFRTASLATKAVNYLHSLQE